MFVDCDSLEALVILSQEVMTFSTEEGAQNVFDYLLNNPTELFDTGYLLPCNISNLNSIGFRVCQMSKL